MTKISEVISYLEDFAPKALQESYDNAGLICGNKNDDISGIIISLDCIEEIIEEAIATNCNLVICHHPIVFKGLKSLTGKNYIEKTVIKAIKNDISIYASHTNLDNVKGGVSFKIAEKIGLKNVKILQPKKGNLQKLITYSPVKDTESVLDALSLAGAGNIGNYSDCSFISEGEGTFKPNEAAKPHIGVSDQLEKVKENRIEVIFPSHLQSKILQALKQAHPYEEVAYYIHDIDNYNQDIGSGVIGELENEIDKIDFFDHLKITFNLDVIRYTESRNQSIKNVALCGGAGSFLLGTARAKGADIFITGDFKYHEFFDAEGQIIIADIGHYESEQYTSELFYEVISKKFTNIAVRLAKTITNPVRYY